MSKSISGVAFGLTVASGSSASPSSVDSLGSGVGFSVFCTTSLFPCVLSPPLLLQATIKTNIKLHNTTINFRNLILSPPSLQSLRQRFHDCIRSILEPFHVSRKLTNTGDDVVYCPLSNHIQII